MLDLPFFIPISFLATTILVFLIFWKASRYSNRFLWLSIAWLSLHGILAFTGFYQNTDARPPRILLSFFPTFVFMLVLFFNENGRDWMKQLDDRLLTILHVIRIPVELVLYFLFVNGVIPELMTFSGRNFDILAGITAPMVYYYGFIKKTMTRRFILIWNVLCLGLLVSIIVNALLSAPLPFQRFAFEQPNIAVLYFPFIWLPAFVVPVVLFSHLVMIFKLLKNTP